MENLNGGYVMLDLNAKGLYDKALALIGVSKPILLYPLNNGTPYYIDKISVVTESGSTYINVNDEYKIASDSTVTTIDDYTLIENIVDKDDNKRFVEGNVNFVVLEGLTKTYGRWSLSGTHLMLTAAGTIASQTTIADGTALFVINDMPSWIRSKITPVYGQIVEYKTIVVINNDYTRYSIELYLDKASNELIVRTKGTVTVPENKTTFFRIQFDLLIDNE